MVGGGRFSHGNNVFEVGTAEKSVKAKTPNGAF